jgi:hypothetical protein
MRSSAFVLAALLLGLGPAPSGPRLLPVADLHPDPTFRLADSVRAQLSQVAELALDPDGSLYLGDYRFPAVLHLEADGRLRRILGRGGSGPGEFSYIFQLGVTRDTLWASDPGLGRVTLFPRDGKGVRTIGYGFAYAGRPRDDVPQLRRGVVVTMLPSGDFIAGTEVKPAGNPEGEAIAYADLRVDRENVVRDTIAIISLANATLRFFYRDGATMLPQPFSDASYLAYASDGSMRARVDRPAAPRGAAEATFTVTAWRGAESRPLWRREVSYRPARITSARIAKALEPFAHPDPAAPPTPITADSIRAHLYLPPMLPPVSAQPVVGRDGHIWLQVQLADTPPDRAEWMLLSPNGYPIRRVTTDPRFRLLEADRSTLWGVIDDRDDVPQVVRYRVPPLAS